MLIRYLLLVALVGVASAADAASRALLVGVAPAAMFGGSKSSIDADVRKMAEIAQRLGVSTSNITMLVHEAATRDAFVSALDQLANGTFGAQDTVLVFFTGFGAPGASGSALASNTAGALVMSDSKAVWLDGQVSMERVVTLADVAQAMDRIGGARALLIADTSRGAISLSAAAFQGAQRFVALSSVGHDLGADTRPEGTRFAGAVYRGVMAHPLASEPLTPRALAERVGDALQQGSGSGAELGGSQALASLPLELVGEPTIVAPVVADAEKYALTVMPEPADARIRIMNIRPRYSDGMLLEPGRYLIEVSSPGFETYSEWVELSSDPQTVAVSLATAPVPEPTPSAETAANGRPIELEATSSEPADAESQIAMVTRPEVVSTTAAPKAKDLSGKRHQDQVSGGQVGPRLTGVTGGCYEMGSPAGERSRNADERQHRVCVDSFWMSYAEVSVADFKTFLGASGYRSAKSEVKGCADPRTVSVDEWAASGDINERPFNQRSGYRLSEQPSDHPVVCVTWRDAMAYAKWLSESTGHKYQLPTESQWEYAARAGSNSAYPWGATVGKNNANCEGCRSGWGRASIVPVGKYPPNSWGFVDLNGNVREWTCSGYGKSGDLAAGCAATGASGSIVVRGGSWKDGPKELRNANRSALAPGHKDNTLGFRVVRVP